MRRSLTSRDETERSRGARQGSDPTAVPFLLPTASSAPFIAAVEGAGGVNFGPPFPLPHNMRSDPDMETPGMRTISDGSPPSITGAFHSTAPGVPKLTKGNSPFGFGAGETPDDGGDNRSDGGPQGAAFWSHTALGDRNLMVTSDDLKPRRVVEDLTLFIRSELDRQGLLTSPPSIERVRVFGQAYEHLLKQMPTYRPVLSAIKKEYDALVDNLWQRTEGTTALQSRLQVMRHETLAKRAIESLERKVEEERDIRKSMIAPETYEAEQAACRNLHRLLREEKEKYANLERDFHEVERLYQDLQGAFQQYGDAERSFTRAEEFSSERCSLLQRQDSDPPPTGDAQGGQGGHRNQKGGDKAGEKGQGQQGAAAGAGSGLEAAQASASRAAMARKAMINDVLQSRQRTSREGGKIAAGGKEKSGGDKPGEVETLNATMGPGAADGRMAEFGSALAASSFNPDATEAGGDGPTGGASGGSGDNAQGSSSQVRFFDDSFLPFTLAALCWLDVKLS
uniref:Translin-associated factor X-interacting protein 1 N-terminal domain-containing protein n=1 Tax=Chromera velia CCMP2878 TaxID=1169474 RepID=A0A0G4GBT9_9ALVE|eukprot:Cvel_4449.t1-p1 / transcript=Cvel_4449.t1 / gene=Cvel_4449 / organism=Chromera_velia_CCMP2878 / gene_product=hypothetical protein / transcript_product=hypothetical protein / location=Cvel_scaffold194:35684-47595(+) / protein_length=509 / sequence_SO=supercontig / SO=protein_coding / is_pseudo=false